METNSDGFKKNYILSKIIIKESSSFVVLIKTQIAIIINYLNLSEITLI